MSTPEYLDGTLLGALLHQVGELPRWVRVSGGTATGLLVAWVAAWPVADAWDRFEAAEVRSQNNAKTLEVLGERYKKVYQRHRRMKDEVLDRLDRQGAQLQRVRTKVEVSNAVLHRIEERLKERGD
jgi:hypothetical protein